MAADVVDLDTIRAERQAKRDREMKDEVRMILDSVGEEGALAMIAEMRAGGLAKHNPNHDERGRFTTADSGGAANDAGTAKDEAARIAESHAALRHEISLTVKGIALTAVTALGVALAPEAAATAAGAFVVETATQVAKNMLRNAALEAGLQVARNAGLDTSRAERVIAAATLFLKAADQGDPKLLLALRPSLEQAGELATSHLIAATRDHYPATGARTTAIHAIYKVGEDYGKRLSEMTKGSTAGDVLRWQSYEFRKLAEITSGMAPTFASEVESLEKQAAGIAAQRTELRKYAGTDLTVKSLEGLEKSYRDLAKGMRKAGDSTANLTATFAGLARAPIPLAFG